MLAKCNRFHISIVVACAATAAIFLVPSSRYELRAQANYANCPTPNSNFLSIEYEGVLRDYLWYEGVIRKSAIENSVLAVNFSIQGTPLEIGIFNRLVRFQARDNQPLVLWASFDYDENKQNPKIVADNSEIVSQFLNRNKVIAPGPSTDFVVSFCGPGDAEFILDFDRKASFATLLEAFLPYLVGKVFPSDIEIGATEVAVVAQRLSPSRLGIIAPTFDKANNHLLAAIRAARAGNTVTAGLELNRFAADFTRFLRNQREIRSFVLEIEDTLRDLAIDILPGAFVNVAVRGARRLAPGADEAVFAWKLAARYGTDLAAFRVSERLAVSSQPMTIRLRLLR